MGDTPRLTSFAPQFLVDDLHRSIAYYERQVELRLAALHARRKQVLLCPATAVGDGNRADRERAQGEDYSRCRLELREQQHGLRTGAERGYLQRNRTRFARTGDPGWPRRVTKVFA